MNSFEWKVEQNPISFGNSYVFYLIYWKLTKPKDYKPFKACSIKFGNDSMSYWVDGAILWHIKYSRLLNLEYPATFKPTSRFDNSYVAAILTNDADKYTFECTLSQQQLMALENKMADIVAGV